MAEQLGLRSVIACRLFAAADSFGTLNVFSTDAGAFDDADEGAMAALAAQVSLALLSERRFEHLREALAHRTVIAQAQGMLMQRYGLQPVSAFAVMRQLSQSENRKLRQIATDIVADGIESAGL